MFTWGCCVNVNTTDTTAGATALLLAAQNTHTLHDPKRCVCIDDSQPMFIIRHPWTPKSQDTGPAYTRMRLPLARGPPDPLLSHPYSISRIQRVFTEMTLRLQSGPHCITACHTYLYSSRARTRRSSLDEKLSPSGARLCHPSACHIIRAHRRPPAHVVPAPLHAGAAHLVTSRF